MLTAALYLLAGSAAILTVLVVIACAITLPAPIDPNQLGDPP